MERSGAAQVEKEMENFGNKIIAITMPIHIAVTDNYSGIKNGTDDDTDNDIDSDGDTSSGRERYW